MRTFRTPSNRFAVSILRCVAATATLLCSTSSLALEEIHIHASLDQASLDDFSASISVIDADTIATRNAQHIDQLLLTVPNTNFSGGASRGRFVQVRGIGDIEQFVDPKAYPNIGLSVDGIELNGIFGAGLLFDTDQVEVLRGPQGTRFGASALAGAIAINSIDASDDQPSYAEAGYGRFNSRQLGIASGGKLSDSINGRIALHQYRSDGYIENDFLDRNNTGGFDEFTGKASLAITTESLGKFTVNLLHLDNDNGYDAFSLESEERTTFSDMPGHDQQRVSAATIINESTLGGGLHLRTQVTHMIAGLDYGFDEDWKDAGLCATAACPFGDNNGFDRYERDRDETTADIRVLGDNFVAGIYWQENDTELDRQRTGDFPLQLESDYETERKAVYAQFTPQLTDNLSASIGARWEEFEDNYTDPVIPVTSNEQELWSAEASLTLEVSDTTRAHVLVSRGNKPGGVNTDAVSNIALIDPSFQTELMNRLAYEQESLTNAEAGIAYQSQDGRLQANATAFYNYRNNPQFETFLYDQLTSFLFVGYQDNADEAESHGVEATINWQWTDSLSAIMNASYLESEFQNFRAYDFDLGSFIQISSKDAPRGGHYQYALTLRYQASDTLAANLQLEGRDSYQYAYYFDEESGNVNLVHASLEHRVEKFTMRIWARNLLDEEYPVHGLYFGNDPREGYLTDLYTQSGEPRNAGVTFRLDLD